LIEGRLNERPTPGQKGVAKADGIGKGFDSVLPLRKKKRRVGNRKSFPKPLRGWIRTFTPWLENTAKTTRPRANMVNETLLQN
jgi:hypothetical protein